MDHVEPMDPQASAQGTAPAESPTPNDERRAGTYELMVIFPATLSEEEIGAVKAKAESAITTQGARITEQEDLGKRKLAFPIKHMRQGFYHLFKFKAPTSTVQKLNEDLKLMPEVLRHLITVRAVKTQAQLDAQKALRERIQAKREGAARAQEALERKEPVPAEPARKVSKEELEKKLEEILSDENLGT